MEEDGGNGRGTIGSRITLAGGFVTSCFIVFCFLKS